MSVFIRQVSSISTTFCWRSSLIIIFIEKKTGLFSIYWSVDLVSLHIVVYQTKRPSRSAVRRDLDRATANETMMIALCRKLKLLVTLLRCPIFIFHPLYVCQVIIVVLSCWITATTTSSSRSSTFVACLYERVVCACVRACVLMIL